MSGKKGKSKGAEGDSGEASGGGKGGTSVKVNKYSYMFGNTQYSFIRFDIFFVKNNQRLWKLWKKSIVV
jgi:hypothetical protein